MANIPSDYQLINVISNVYPNKTWYDKVSAMPHEQLVALYLKFKEEGKIK